MPFRGTKRRRAKDCDGCGCGDPTCPSCDIQSEDDGRAPDRPFNAGKSYRNPAEQSLAGNRQASAASETAIVDLTGSDHDPGSTRQRAMYTPKSAGVYPRASTPAATAEKEPSFREMVDALDEKTLRSTLVRLASIAPSAQTVIRQAYTQQTKERAATPGPTDFDHYSKKAWHALHTSDAARKWEALDEIRRIGATKRTLETVSGYVVEIRRAVRKTAPFHVKVDALETIRKILKSILLGSNGLAEGVRTALADSEEIGDCVTLIMMDMTEADMIRAGGTADEKGTLAQKFRWCRDEAEKYGLLKLSAVLSLWSI